jgi:type I restriction enzyme S subunit
MSEWRQVELGQIADVRVSNVDKKTVPGEIPVQLCNYMNVYSNDYIRGHLDFMQASATVTEIARFKVELGDVLITKDSETPDDIGIPSVVTNEIDNLICGYHVALIKPNKSLVDSVYLSKQLGRAETAGYFARYAAGSTRYGLPMGAMNRTPIALPPLAQQRKIATILSTIDTAIEQTEALIEKYQHIKAGLMHDLFTRGVLPNGQLRPPREQAPELYQETAIGWIPREWEIVRMNKLAEDRKGSTTIGPFGSDLVATDYQQEGVPIVFVRDVKESGFEWNSDTYVSHRKARQLAAHKVAAGDVLASKMGLPPCISCLYPDWMPDGVITADMIRLSPDKKSVNGHWLTSAINQDRVKRQIAAITAGVTRPKVTLADFRNIRVAKPALTEQNRISDKLKLAQSMLDTELVRVSKLQVQKLGLMQDLLTGKVPVTVDAPPSEAVA